MNKMQSSREGDDDNVRMHKVVVLDRDFPKQDDSGVVSKDDPRQCRLAPTIENRDEDIADHRRIRQAEITSTKEEEEVLDEEEEESETDSVAEMPGITMIKYVYVPKAERDKIAEGERLEAEEQALEELAKEKLEKRMIKTKKIVVDKVRKDQEIRKNMLLEEANIGEVEIDKFVDDVGESFLHDGWGYVMEAEIIPIEDNNTWELVELREGAKVIGVKAKRSEKGDVGKFKARLVSKNMENSSEHVDVRYHFLRELVNDGVIHLNCCTTQEHAAYIMTKAEKLEFLEV